MKPTKSENNSVTSGKANPPQNPITHKKRKPDILFLKDQSVSIPDFTHAIVKEPIPNQHGEILVQIMKWVPLDHVKLNYLRSEISAGQRKSGRTRRRPPYLTEDYSFFNEPDGKYSSLMTRNKLNKSTDHRILVISAYRLDPISGEATTVYLSKEARTRSTNSFGKEGEVPYVAPKQTRLKKVARSNIKAEVNYAEDVDDEECDQPVVNYVEDVDDEECDQPVDLSEDEGETEIPSEESLDSSKDENKVFYHESDSSDDDDKILYNSPNRIGKRGASTARSIPEVNYAEDVDDEKCDQPVDSSEDEDKIPYSPSTRKRGAPKKSKKKMNKCMKISHHPPSQLVSLWVTLSVDKKTAMKKIKSFLPLDLQPGAERLAELLLFCHERQQIWMRRKRGVSPPWTKDNLLDTKHFTNMYRELDAGTVYFRRHVLHLKRLMVKGILVGEDDFATEVLWASICYRCLCRVETFEELGGIPSISSWKEFREGLRARYADGEKLFTAAYQVMGFRRYVETMEFLHDSGCEELHRLSKKVRSAGEEGLLEKLCTKVIKLLPNFGNFYAWQVTCDLMESGILKGCNEGTSDWVQLGPGAENGLKYIFSHCSHSYKKNELCRLIRDKQKNVLSALGVTFVRFDDRDMSLKVLEHALCEFYKYTKCAANQGSSTAMRIYTGKGNGSAVPKDTALCTGNFCASSLKKGQYLCCDTCWRCFCTQCSHRTVLGKITFMCEDCRCLSKK